MRETLFVKWQFIATYLPPNSPTIHSQYLFTTLIIRLSFDSLRQSWTSPQFIVSPVPH